MIALAIVCAAGVIDSKLKTDRCLKEQEKEKDEKRKRECDWACTHFYTLADRALASGCFLFVLVTTCLSTGTAM